MDKPKKKELYGDGGGWNYINGYNQACEEWKKYHNWKMSQLPNKKELSEIIVNLANLSEKHGIYFTEKEADILSKDILKELNA